MSYLWDYKKEDLQKTEEGKILILERMIKFGPGKERIKLADVKKYWRKLNINPSARRLLRMLIWGK